MSSCDFKMKERSRTHTNVHVDSAWPVNLRPDFVTDPSKLVKIADRPKVPTEGDDQVLDGMFGDRLIFMIELPEKRPMKALVKGNIQFGGVCLKITPGTRIKNRDEPSLVSLSTDPEGSIVNRFPGGGDRFGLAKHAPQQQAHQRSIAVGRIASMADRRSR